MWLVAWAAAASGVNRAPKGLHHTAAILSSLRVLMEFASCCKWLCALFLSMCFRALTQIKLVTDMLCVTRMGAVRCVPLKAARGLSPRGRATHQHNAGPTATADNEVS